MPNAFSKEEIVFFEQVLQGFDPNNITAKQVQKYQVPATTFERSAQTVHRPIPYVSVTTTGLTVSTFEDTTQLSVPSTLNLTTDFKNVPFTMTPYELNDPDQRNKKAKSAVQALSALIDSIVATKVALEGTVFVPDATTLTTYNQIAAAETPLTIDDVAIMEPRTLIMNATDYNGVSGNLANRDAPPTGVSLTAFERSKIPTVATFDSFKASFMPTQNAAAGGASITVTGVQAYTPLATDANGNNVDNRSMNLVVSATAGVAAGDAFTIDGIFATSMIHKNVTQNLRTFRVLEVVDGTNLTISPTITPKDGAAQSQKEYANVNTSTTDGAAIVFLNLASAPSNIFFINTAVEIIHGSLATMELDGSAGVASMRESTDSGIEILFAKASNISDLGTEYRLTMWANANILNPQMCGNLVGNQV